MIEKDIPSASELARLLDISRSSVSMILNGAQQPTIETVGRLCEVLDCTPNDLFVMGETVKGVGRPKGTKFSGRPKADALAAGIPA